MVCQWEKFKAHVLGGTQDALDLYLHITRLHPLFAGTPLEELLAVSHFPQEDYGSDEEEESEGDDNIS